MGFLDKLLGRKPEGDEAQAATPPAGDTATDTAGDTAVTTEQDDAHDQGHDHGEQGHTH
jgi:hypothetical protein